MRSTGQARALGCAVLAALPVALIARSRAGAVTAPTRTLLVEADERVVARLWTRCATVGLEAESRSVRQLRCTADDGDTGVSWLRSAPWRTSRPVRRRWPPRPARPSGAPVARDVTPRGQQADADHTDHRPHR